MKKSIIILNLLIYSFYCTAQSKVSKIPIGTYFKDGKIKINTDYKAVVTNEGISIIKKEKAAGETTGSFSCSCEGATATSCPVNFTDDIIVCGGDVCCKLKVKITSGTGTHEASAGNNPVENVPVDKWSIVIFPKVKK